MEVLRTAKVSIDIAMYSFSDRELAEELGRLARSGVRVRVYRDSGQYEQESQRGLSTTEILLAAGVQVRVKASRDLMHLKSYAIDGALLRTGSANWSRTGLKRQDNDLRYEVDPVLVRLFETRFAGMWDRSKQPHPVTCDWVISPKLLGHVDNVRLLFAYTSAMGGERASTSRMRLAGKICCNCKRSLPPLSWNERAGERYCDRCATHKVYLSFHLCTHWICTFLEPDLKTSVGPIRRYRSEESVREMARRGKALKMQEDHQALNHAIQIGRGGFYLQLTGEQYLKLKA